MPRQKADYADDAEIDETLDRLADDETVEEAVANAEERGFDVIAAVADEAVETVTAQMLAGVSVMNGRLTTLEGIGFDELLSEGDYERESLPDRTRGIDDAERQTAPRESQTADRFLGGINAAAQTGELVAADLSGSRVGAYPFAAGNVVIVTGTNNVVPTLDDAFDRLESVAYPLENERAQEAYGAESAIAKQFAYRRETEGGRTTVVLVREQLGY